MRDLREIIHPRSVAVVGASKTPGKIGYAVLENIISSGFPGEVYPVNPKEREIMGKKCYPTVGDVGKPVDVAVLCVPAQACLPVAEDCGKAGIHHLVVITAGFKETGKEGRELENQLVSIVRRYDMRMVGPNCLGVMDTSTPINATFSKNFPLKGHIAFISQSGALCIAILDWSLKRGLGFSQFISMGNKGDLNEADYIEMAADDPETKVIALYLEDIADGQRFIESARKASLKKPIVVLKVGVSASGAKAASSHTGALAGSDTAYDAALAHAGVLRASTMTELFDMAVAFTNQPIPRGKRIAIVTNSGGPGVVATDAVELCGLEMARFSAETESVLRENLPAMANIHNPVDVIGDAHYDRYEMALDTVLKDPGVDGVSVLLAPTAVLEVGKVAEVVVDMGRKYPDKPLVAAFTGGAAVEEAVKYLAKHGVPTYDFPEPAVATLRGMVRYADLRRSLTDGEPWLFGDVDRKKVEDIFRRVREDGRDLLLGPEACEVAEAYGIPAAPSRLAKTSDEAVRFARELGYPVVMKIASPDILHKTDVGGVRVGIKSGDEVAKAFDEIVSNSRKAEPKARIYGVEIQKMMPSGHEIIIGMTKDPTFGPLVAFGSGGILVNLLKDAAFRLARGLTRAEVDSMIRETKAYTILKGFRGAPPDDLEAVALAIGRTAQLVRDFDQIVEMDINPVFAYPKGLSALDVKIRIA
ncbi:MAG TPA: CoA-binding protein [Firmicutes bacterium]|nr:CoA-binding protein [Candidatus Fermentithermobacillaceae bacterium]